MSNVDGPLKQYVTDRSDDAFRALVERHGPMVAATCRRVLGDDSEVQDAAQAVFLILARKAGSVGDELSLGPWLHRVAVRVACEMKRKKQVRGAHERKAAAQRPEAARSGVSDEESARARAALDEEIDALPENLRLPVVLCLVGQKPVAQAAKDLGLTDGQVRGRLDRARERLRQALTVRGVGVSSAVMPLLLTEALSGEPLIGAGVMTKLFAAGAYVTAGASGLGSGVSQNVLVLAETVTAQLVKAKVLNGLLLAALAGSLLAGGTLGVAWAVDGAKGSPVPAGTTSGQVPVTKASAPALDGQTTVAIPLGKAPAGPAGTSPAAKVRGRTLSGAGVEVLHYQPVPFETGPEPAGTETIPRGWVRRPAFLDGAMIYSHEPSNVPDQASHEPGVTVFRATSSGVVIIACAYGYQGNQSGGWTKDVSGSKELQAQGWDPVGMAVSAMGREFTLFAKEVKAGDLHRIRCNKYEPPYVIVKDMIQFPDELKSEFPSARPLALAGPGEGVAPGSSPRASWTVGAVWGLEPVPMMQKPAQGQKWPGWDEVPQELRGCQIFSKESQDQGVHHAGAADFVVQKDGVIFLAGQLDLREGNLEGDWDERRLTVKNFEEAGWAFVGSMRDANGLAYAVFRKTVLAGQRYRVRTNKYTPTFVMVKP